MASEWDALLDSWLAPLLDSWKASATETGLARSTASWSGYLMTREWAHVSDSSMAKTLADLLLHSHVPPLYLHRFRLDSSYMYMSSSTLHGLFRHCQERCDLLHH